MAPVVRKRGSQCAATSAGGLRRTPGLLADDAVRSEIDNPLGADRLRGVVAGGRHGSRVGGRERLRDGFSVHDMSSLSQRNQSWPESAAGAGGLAADACGARGRGRPGVTKRTCANAGIAEQSSAPEPGAIGEDAGFRIEVIKLASGATGTALIHTWCPFLGRGGGESPWPGATGPLAPGSIQDGRLTTGTSPRGTWRGTTCHGRDLARRSDRRGDLPP